MSAAGYHLFDTAIGRCGVAWGERGICGLQLPEASVAAARSRLRSRFPSASEQKPPREVSRAIKQIQALLAGKRAILSDLVLDMEAVSPFHRRVYEAARAIPSGRTASYGDLATKLKSPNSARAVGQALGRNPFPIVVPCHRVLASGGKPGGFTAEGGLSTKARMLAIEGVELAAAATLRNGRESRAARPDVSGPLDLKKAVRFLRGADPVLARLIDSVGACRLEQNAARSIFNALAEAIVYQQLTGKAAATIHGRVCALFPAANKGYTPRHILGASDEALRGCGLSRAKTAALRDLAQKTADGELPTFARAAKMSDDELIETLTTVRGIGRWTVEMLLMFRLGRADVLPVDDYGVRKGFAVAWRKRELPSRDDLARHGEKWKPYRSVASWYMWRAAENAPRREQKKRATDEREPGKRAPDRKVSSRRKAVPARPARAKPSQG